MIVTELVGDRVVIALGDNERLALTIEEARELLVDLDIVLPQVTHEEAVAMITAQLGGEVVEVGAPCVFDCGHVVLNDDFHAYREVTGFVKLRKAGGANAVALRRPTGRVAHAHCVQGSKKQVEGQQTLG